MNRTQMYTTSVRVFDGEECEITLVLQGKTWKAHGTYKKQFFQGRGARTESAAIENFKSAVKYSSDY